MRNTGSYFTTVYYLLHGGMFFCGKAQDLKRYYNANFYYSNQ